MTIIRPTRPPARGGLRERLARLRKRSRATALPSQGSLRWSMNWAVDGLIYTLRTQRNMQIHLAAATLAVVLAVSLDVSRMELLAIIISATLVLLAEMMNTAIEAAVDAVITDYHPLVKVAKDVAAGAATSGWA